MKRPDVALDLEVYPNYVLIAFKQVGKKGVMRFELIGEDSSLTKDDKTKLVRLLRSARVFGFNSLSYDLPLILSALQGCSASEICKRGNDIIQNEQYPYYTMGKLGLEIPQYLRHFDIKEVAVGVMISLKLYGGRMNAPKLQDLPIAPNTLLTPEEMRLISLYNVNDLDTTIMLYKEIKEAVDLRTELTAQYGIDLMSKSDAQVAEHLITHQVSKLRGKAVLKPTGMMTHVSYKVPDYVEFRTPILQTALDFIRTHEFEIDGRGSIVLPPVLAKNAIKIGDTEYQMGVGGLHSKDSKLRVVPTKNQLLLDRDVTSYYPQIILNLGLYPKQMGTHFLTVYRQIVEDRVESKNLISSLSKQLAKGENVADQLAYHENRAASYKIVANGSFGKFGSKYSKLYSPDLMARVTLTGQLSLLMLIERLELAGIKVVSANTDGFVSLMDKSQFELYDTICFDWELDTNFNLEETSYKGLYSRDVNNYFAVTTDGKVKGKGVYAKSGIAKNPTMPIVAKAVIDYILNTKPFIETLKGCKDFTQFLSVRTVNGGAVSKDNYVGRVVRWVYTTDGDVINYAKNGNKVPKSDGGEPFQDLPKEFPKNLDFQRYVFECEELLKSMGEHYENT